MQTRAHIHTHTHTSMMVLLLLLELLHAEQHKLFAKSSKVCVCIAFKPSSLMLLVLPIFVGKMRHKNHHNALRFLSRSCLGFGGKSSLLLFLLLSMLFSPLLFSFNFFLLLLPKDDDCFFQTRGDFPSERRLCRLMMTPTILPLPLPLPRRRRRRLQEVVEEKEGARSRRKAPQKSNASVRKTAIA